MRKAVGYFAGGEGLLLNAQFSKTDLNTLNISVPLNLRCLLKAGSPAKEIIIARVKFSPCNSQFELIIFTSLLNVVSCLLCKKIACAAANSIYLWT